MPVQVRFSNCGNPDTEALVRQRCSETFGNVPEEWMVSVVRAGGTDCNMTITGPSNFKYELSLSAAAGEQNPEFIVTAIKQAIVGELSG